MKFSKSRNPAPKGLNSASHVAPVLLNHLRRSSRDIQNPFLRTFLLTYRFLSYNSWI